MNKKNLIIMNPCSGKRRANKHLADIINLFTGAGYMNTVLMTTKQGDGTVYANEYAKDYDLVTCIGGDGTFNEVVAGVLENDIDVTIGYIPAGSTNDFAASLGLSSDIMEAAEDIVKGKTVPIDIGRFNDRKFSYVASFGAFTQTSYSTPQNIKNTLGHVAYVLEGVASIPSIRKEHLKIVTADGSVYEDDYVFGAITNATSLGGVLNLDPNYVDMSDGKFEMLLVKAPKTPIDVAEIVTMLSMQSYDSKLITFISSNKFEIHANENMDWSIDGEYQQGCKDILIENLHNSVKIIINDRPKPKPSEYPNMPYGFY